MDGPVILVGHSWGGAVITEAGDDTKVVGLVYVAAWMPDIGKSANQTSEPFHPTPVLKEIKVDAQHFASLSEDGVINDFANGLPMTDRRLVLAVRETPLHLGHLRTMTALSEMGAIIAPPVPALYAKPQTIGEMIDHTLGRLLDLFELDSGTVRRWGEPVNAPEN